MSCGIRTGDSLRKREYPDCEEVAELHFFRMSVGKCFRWQISRSEDLYVCHCGKSSNVVELSDMIRTWLTRFDK